MGSMKEEFMQQQKHKRNIVIAQQLGITVEELYETEFEIVDDPTKDGIILSHTIKFSKDSPKEILQKIFGLDETNSVSINRIDDFESDADENQ
jgi:hypothetical protein